MRILVSLVTVGIALVVSSCGCTVHAAREFATAFTSVYTIGQNDITTVEHTIEITNKLSHIYTTEYSSTIGSDRINNLSTVANGVDVRARVEKANGQTQIAIPVTNPAIGIGQTLVLKVGYDTQDLTEHYGDVWEINIPRLQKANEADTYIRRVIVPESFGTPTVEHPHSTSVASTDDGHIVYEYVGYPGDSISLLFGDHVTYKLDLTYSINNPTISAAETEIAIPPDTEYQRVVIDTIDPAPSYVRLDSDGNWLAVYPLRSQESKSIAATLYIDVYPIQRFPGTTQDVDRLRASTPVWNTEAKSVADLASQLSTPANFYSYLVSNMQYDYGRVTEKGERLGAEKALSNPSSAICTEFTDTFVALARASGIPAREINGYARNADTALRPAGFAEDILHAWPEYYDAEKKSWIQVDPTWGNTTGGVDYFHKLDYGHIAFVRHGKEANYPYPAGSYKNDPAEKSIRVEIARTEPQIKEDTKLVKQEGSYKVINTGNVSLRNHTVELPTGSTHTISYIAPYGFAEVTNGHSIIPGFLERIWTFIKNIWS